MKTLLLCLTLGVIATLFSSCASTNYSNENPDLQHMPPAPVTGY